MLLVATNKIEVDYMVLANNAQDRNCTTFQAVDVFISHIKLVISPIGNTVKLDLDLIFQEYK